MKNLDSPNFFNFLCLRIVENTFENLVSTYIMTNPRKKRGKSERKRRNENSELSDPGNCKQTKGHNFSKWISTNENLSGTKEKRMNKDKLNTTRIVFQEDDEDMTLEVSQEEENKFIRKEGEDSSSLTDGEGEFSQDERVSSDNDEGNATQNSENNNAIIREIESENDEFEPQGEELKSMLKFAKFLESRGFITQRSEQSSVKDDDNCKKDSRKGDNPQNQEGYVKFTYSN